LLIRFSLSNLMEVSPSWEDHLSFFKLLISKPSLHKVHWDFVSQKCKFLANPGFLSWYSYQTSSNHLFAICVQLRSIFTLLFIADMHYMFRPNWPSSVHKLFAWGHCSSSLCTVIAAGNVLQQCTCSVHLKQVMGCNYWVIHPVECVSITHCKILCTQQSIISWWILLWTSQTTCFVPVWRPSASRSQTQKISKAVTINSTAPLSRYV
jgi:hypothetical protein